MCETGYDLGFSLGAAVITSGMQVSLQLKMYDSEGELVGAPEEPMVYIHGAGEIFARLEDALAGKNAGDTVLAYLQPEDHFGDYDAQLLRVEERSKFPDELEVGMQFEGTIDDDEDPAAEEEEDDPPIFRVTDITEETVVLDGNHPLAGMALRFEMQVLKVEPAPEPEEEDDDDDGDDSDEGGPEFREVKRTLH
jgi:FKBP-type peptidyl-prolyl cis-trans isomerase SlyD